MSVIRHSKVAFSKQNYEYPYANPYPIREYAQCLGRFSSSTKNIFQRLITMANSVDLFRSDVESIENILKSNGALEVVAGNGDSMQKLLQDIRTLVSTAEKISGNLPRMKDKLDSAFDTYSSADDEALKKYQDYQDSLKNDTSDNVIRRGSAPSR